MEEDTNILLADEEYREMLTDYVKAYAKILKALPNKKKQLIVNYNSITEKIIVKRIRLSLSLA